MKTQIFKLIAALMVLAGFSSSLWAKGAGTSGGLTLIETSGARSAAMGEAFSAMSNELCAMNYNPASLGTLKTGQASFMYQKGLVEDSYGQFIIGAPRKNGAWGLQVGYYNGGDMEVSFDGNTSQTVNAQRDLMLNFGYGWNVRESSIGLNLKYLSSELIEREKATAYAADFGLSMPVGSRLRIGGAVQNFGTQMKYVDEGDNLPRIVRAGMAINLIQGRSPLTLLMDSPYFMNEAELRPAVGLELGLGVLALRAGYRKLGDANEFSVGTGFLLGRTSFDYSFGMMQDFDSQQRVSLSMRFGGVSSQPAEFTKKKDDKKEKEVVATAPAMRTPAFKLSNTKSSSTGVVAYKKANQAPSRVYYVKPGDSLGSISAKYYGRKDMWKNIYNANRHLIDDPKSLEPGQKILIP